MRRGKDIPSFNRAGESYVSSEMSLNQNVLIFLFPLYIYTHIHMIQKTIWRCESKATSNHIIYVCVYIYVYVPSEEMGNKHSQPYVKNKCLFDYVYSIATL